MSNEISDMMQHLGAARETNEWKKNPVEAARKYAKEVAEEHEIEVDFKWITFEMFGGTRTHGQFEWERGKKRCWIKLSQHTLKNHGIEQTKKTVRHELVHAWQYQTGRSVDHGPGFEQWMEPLGIDVTEDIRPDGR